MGSYFLGIPYFSPVGEPFSNDDIKKQFFSGNAEMHAELDKYWSKTGTKMRWLDLRKQNLTECGVKALQQVCEINGLKTTQIDTLIYCGIYKEKYEPAVAAEIAHAAKLNSLFTFDVSSACAAMALGVQVSCGLMELNRKMKNVALISVDLPSIGIDFNFGKHDVHAKAPALTLGAAVSALVVSREKPKLGIAITGFENYHDASYANASQAPFDGYFTSDSDRLSRPLIRSLVKVASLMDNNHERQWLLPHQPGSRVSELSDILKIPKTRVIVVHERYGNTAASGWVSAYHTLLAERKSEIKPNDPVLVQTFASGFASVIFSGRLIQG